MSESGERVIDDVLRDLLQPPRSLRSLRYRGDDRAARLSEMTEHDRGGVRTLYAALCQLSEALAARRDETPATLAEIATAFDVDAAFAAARMLGRVEAPRTDAVGRALHDVRGGALTSLLVEVQRLRRGGVGGVTAARTLEVLALDHLKIMRNALLELDDVRREADLAPCPHLVGRLSESLSRVTGEGRQGEVRVDVRCDFSGAITMSCVELGALDRATLNLVNNAIRHAAGDTVITRLLPVVGEVAPDLRILVANPITQGDARAIVDRFGSDLPRMFLDPFSTTGSGEGLKICTDFVSSAYGLVRGADAVQSGLVGAAVQDGWFVAWLHWPSVA